MAGKKQHFIPQHFQKPFVILGGSDQLWMFRIGNSFGVKVARKKAAAQEYFYSKPSTDGSLTLDDLVTEYENELHATVDNIRALEIGSDIDSREISRVVAHLSLRSSHMRRVMRECVLTAVSSIQRLMRGELVNSLNELPPSHPPSGIYQVIIEEVKKLHLSHITRITEPVLVKLIYFMIRERSQELVNGVSPQITEVLDQIKTDATKISQSAQMDVLQETMAPEALISRLSQLVWHVVSVESAGVILPDCTSIAFDGHGWKPLILTSTSEVKVVALPLAPNRLAIGKVDVNQTMDVSQFNRHAAHASESFFLSNHTSKELEKLSEISKGRIGMLTNRIVDSAVSEAVEETLNNLLEDDESVENQYASKIAWKGEALESEQSFSISFKDFGDEAFGNAVAEEIKVLIIYLSEILPVSAIDGFTFACDYDSAISSVDRGFEIRNKITLAKIEGFVGMGIPITIVSDGKIKTRGVMRSGVAIDLVSHNEELVDNARSAVVHILASGALTKLIANKFPQQILKPVKDPYEAFLYGYTSQVFLRIFFACLSQPGLQLGLRKRSQVMRNSPFLLFKML